MNLNFKKFVNTKLLSICFFLCFISSSYANDSIARRGVGGIEFIKTDDIRMIEEVLEISPEIVRVKYRFKNESSVDIRTTVAFPMPVYSFEPGVNAYTANNKPLKGFTVNVDNKTIPTKSDRKAIFNATDVTKQLREAGLTENQIFKTFADCKYIFLSDGNSEFTCGLSKKQTSDLAKIGFVKDIFWPLWEVEETIYWEQTFPSQKEIIVEHEYSPFVGEFYYYNSLDDKSAKEVCLDERTERAIEKRFESRKKGESIVFVKEVEYILKTGKNWIGPIRHFKLRVKKSDPNQLVSLCFPRKAARINATTFEFTAEDFTPPDKLVVYYFSDNKEN